MISTISPADWDHVLLAEFNRRTIRHYKKQKEAVTS